MKKLLLSLGGGLAVFVFSASFSFAASPSDLVGWWKMDGDANDSSTYNNHGSPTAVDFSSGDKGVFNDSTSNIRVNDNNSLDITNAITIEALIDPSSTAGYRAIVSKRLNSISNYSFRIWDGKLEFYYRSGADSEWSEWSTNTAVTFSSDKQDHVAVVYTWGGDIKVYLNGDEQIGTWIKAGAYQQPTVDSNNYPLYIGYNYIGSPQTFQGEIGDVKIWKTALSKDELENSLDTDEDSIDIFSDKCPGTVLESPDVSLGVNRWIWNGDWKTTPSNGKGPNFKPTMGYTYGCSCEQILDEMTEVTDKDFGGHYKFGCSKSILEDWNRGTYYIGPTLIETVEVPASAASGVTSAASTEIGKNYFLKATGTGMACNQPGCQITFDAEYSTSDGTNWVDGVAVPYDSYGVNLLDLKVDNAFVDWGLYNSGNTYQIPYAGTGNPLSLLIYDLAGSYFNDTGSLFVDLIEDKWVSLW